ncbi:MAG: T9SS type A sorting domain-containing protein, partial [Candidatus Cloacimonadota bacterium]|nr:T9SS type A sorting domain-containing protein [Candidatus Cloacimonadota bacterium]
PGFGFSEFFQKEFFQLLFQNNVNIFSELNYMQKIPFIPYFEGVSIYKWIGYELNALGDSYLQILIQTPLSLDVAAQSGEGEVKFWVKSNSSAVANAVVTLGEQQGYTDENGEITFPNNDGIVEVYKFGYKYFTSDLQTITSPLCLEINQGIDDDGYAQSETFQINSTLHNSSNEDIEFIVEYEFNEEELILQILGEHPAVIEANTSLELSSVQLQIKPIDSSYQMPSGKVIPLVQKIVEVNSNNILWQHNYNIKIIAPAFQMSQLEWENYDLVPGMQSDFSFKIKNIGNLVSEAVQISFTSSEDWISIADDMIELDNLPPDSSATLCNQMIISENSPPEFWVDIGLNIEVDDLYSYTESISVPNSNFGYNNNFESDFNWNGDSSWQIVDTYAYEGEYSLSCRPSDIGYYATESEYFYFLPGMELNFAYRYKMPMYGEDGFFVRLHRESKIDTLIFLGAGGALPSENGEKGYIEADWNQYNLNIQDLTTHDWERGELFKIDFLFSYPEKESGINDYYNMPEIGIFIDNFQLATTGIVDADTFPNATEKIITLYPNPFNSKLNLKIDSNNDGKVEIFNAKGQKVDEINKARNQISLHWNADHQPSGIYFIKWQDANNTVTKKCLLLK